MEIVYLVMVLLLRDGSVNTSLVEQPSIEACRQSRDLTLADAKADWQAEDMVASCQVVHLVKGVPA
jgi:hypothetical protein